MKTLDLDSIEKEIEGGIDFLILKFSEREVKIPLINGEDTCPKGSLRKYLETMAILFQIVKFETGFTRSYISSLPNKTEKVHARAAIIAVFTKIYPGISPGFVVRLVGRSERTVYNHAGNIHDNLMSSMNDYDEKAKVYRRIIQRACEYFSLDYKRFC